MKILLQAGADANIRSLGRQRRTPLHAAAVLGDEAVTVELLRWGAMVDIPDSEGITSLQIAAAVDNVAVARCLLQAGASTTTVQAGTLNTPLHVAAFQGSRRSLVSLLRAGADVSARNVNRETPLHHASMMMDLAIVEVLLRHGGDEAARDSDNQTPSDVLGQALDDEMGRNGGSPELRERIATLLARAPAERAWRRRSWLVMMRARVFMIGHQKAPWSEMRGTAKGEASQGRAARRRDLARGSICKVEQAREFYGTEGIVGAGKKAPFVRWLVGAQEVGIFRNVVSFL